MCPVCRQATQNLVPTKNRPGFKLPKQPRSSPSTDARSREKHPSCSESSFLAVCKQKILPRCFQDGVWGHLHPLIANYNQLNRNNPLDRQLQFLRAQGKDSVPSPVLQNRYYYFFFLPLKPPIFRVSADFQQNTPDLMK